MADKKVRWEEMFPQELLDAIAVCPVVFVAYGLAEPHGAYSALGLDWLKAQGLCERAARKHGGVVAPPMCWHVAEMPRFNWVREMGVEQPLCSSIPPELFLRMVLHQLRVFDARGFHAAVLITGHYGGLQNDMRLLCEFYLRRTGSPMQIYCIADHECIEFEGYHGDHAGLCETQQLMALRPELVDLTRPEPGPWIGRNFAADGQLPTREIGEKIVASQVAALGREQAKLLQAYHPAPGWTPPDQDCVEQLWQRFERLTKKYWVMSCCWEEFGNGPPAFPGWDALGL